MKMMHVSLSDKGECVCDDCTNKPCDTGYWMNHGNTRIIACDDKTIKGESENE